MPHLHRIHTHSPTTAACPPIHTLPALLPFLWPQPMSVLSLQDAFISPLTTETHPVSHTQILSMHGPTHRPQPHGNSSSLNPTHFCLPNPSLCDWGPTSSAWDSSITCKCCHFPIVCACEPVDPLLTTTGTWLYKHVYLYCTITNIVSCQLCRERACVHTYTGDLCMCLIMWKFGINLYIVLWHAVSAAAGTFVNHCILWSYAIMYILSTSNWSRSLLICPVMHACKIMYVILIKAPTI